MEFCPRTLRDVLDSGELGEEARWSILRQILAGLAHIHAQGIIHRDLKPANTFLGGRGARTAAAPLLAACGWQAALWRAVVWPARELLWAPCPPSVQTARAW